MSYWFLRHRTIRCQGKSWEKDKYNWDPQGLGDSLIHSAYVYLYKRDLDLLRNIIVCLKLGKRWNNQSNPPDYARGYRSQYSMTRDVYIVCYSVLHLTGTWIPTPRERIPWYLWRPDFYFWMKFITTKDKKYIPRYEWWAVLNIRLFGRFLPVFAKLLAGWMSYTTQSEKVKNELKKRIPEWHLLLRCLVGDEPELKEIREYLSRQGFTWTSETGNKDRTPLPLDEDYYVDKDLLIWIYQDAFEKKETV